MDVVPTVCFGCVIRKERDTMQFLIYVTSVLLVLGKYTHKNALLRVRKCAKMFFANRFCNQRGYNSIILRSRMLSNEDDEVFTLINDKY